MEPSSLRLELLRLLDQHEATGSSAYVEDDAMASKLGVPLLDVERQLSILENRGLVTLAKTYGPR
jgi:hypothetical protein